MAYPIETAPRKSLLIATASPVLSRGIEAALAPAGFGNPVICADAAQLHAAFLSRPPDIAIVDGMLLPGPSLLLDLLEAAPRCRLLLLGRHLAPEMIESLVRTGVCYVLSPAVPPAELLRFVQALGDRPAVPKTPAAWLGDHLTADERRLISLVTRGLQDREIAALMQCTERQVNSRLKGLIRRLDVVGRCELALYGLAGVAVEPLFDSEVIR